MPAPGLRELQERFWRSLAAAPGGGAEEFDVELVAAILPSPTLAPAERLGIYAGMYFARIRDAVREDFPRLAALLGEDGWEALMRRYLAAHPSTHPSLRWGGRHLPDFLAGDPAGSPPALVDLARLEWTRLDAFDAPDADPLSAMELARIPPDAWATVRFRPVPSFRVLWSRWPVHRIWAGEAGLDVPPAPTLLRVWRQDWTVYHATMGPEEAVALDRVAAGAPFAEVCEPFATADATPDAAAAEAVSRLARWLEDGLLVRPPAGQAGSGL